MRSDRYGPDLLTSGTQSRCAISQIRETPIVQRSFAPLSLTNAKDFGLEFPPYELENFRLAGEEVRFNEF